MHRFKIFYELKFWFWEIVEWWSDWASWRRFVVLEIGSALFYICNAWFESQTPSSFWTEMSTLVVGGFITITSQSQAQNIQKWENQWNSISRTPFKTLRFWRINWIHESKARRWSSENFAMVNWIWPTAVAGEADSVSSVSALACHIGGQILLTLAKFC